jgi:hypothetical protein
VVGNVSPDGLDVSVSATFAGRVTPVDPGGHANDSGATRWVAYLVASNAATAERMAVAAQHDWHAGRVDPQHVSIDVRAVKGPGVFGRRRRNAQLPTV